VPESVLITSGSSVWAHHLILRLSAGGFRIRIAIRPGDDIQQQKNLLSNLDIDPLQVTFVDIRPLETGGWAEALDGCHYVCHSLLPKQDTRERTEQPSVSTTRDELMKLIQSARNEIDMKRIVIISSICSATGIGEKQAKSVRDETHWNNIADQAASLQVRSITYAERALWDYVASTNAGLEITTLLSGFLIGPRLGESPTLAMSIFNNLLDGRYPGLPRLGGCLTDARDLAEAQFRALTSPQAAGQRYMVAGEFIWMSEAAAILRQVFPQMRDVISAVALPDAIIHLLKPFYPELKEITPLLGREYRVSTDKLEAQLGMTLRENSYILTDTARSMIGR
tara:strand:+ start:471 stop:1487 length:1017 start_codon:yes stop_codon:yes gene_type:complete